MVKICAEVLLMNNSNKKINYFKQKYQTPIDKIKLIVKNQLGWLGRPKLILYPGFGSESSGQVYTHGVLLEDNGLAKTSEKNSVWQNILAMLKRYSGDQIPDTKVEIRLNGYTTELSTDNTGHFRATFPFSNHSINRSTRWINYEATLLDKLDDSENIHKARGEILIPGNNAQYGVISDIDDTIMVSHSTKTIRKLRLMLTRNSRTRKPFPGVEAFYQALNKGVDGKKENPFFYISSSEWNLYDLISDFCAYNLFPKGVYLLKDMDPRLFKLWKQGGGTHEHKYEKIKMVFETFPALSFVLVGDNGQRDPMIYSRIAKLFAHRVKAIYIRTIKKYKDDRMKKLIADMEKINVKLVFTPDTINAAQHARSNLLITEESVGKVVKNSFRDK